MRNLPWVIACFAAVLTYPQICKGLDKESIQAAKEATGFVSHKNGSASAFCISEKGIFVTNDHIIENSRGEKLTLVLNPGTEKESSHEAEVVRRDKTSDLALLRIELGDTPPPRKLELSSSNELFETQELVAFGFPFGRALATKKDALPAISVNIGRITALRKEEKELDLIQLDAQLNPGNSGGPVLDPEGKVVGVVSSGIPGAGVNFAIPTSKLFSLLEKPNLSIKLPEISFKDRHKKIEMISELVWLQDPPDDFKISLRITTGEKTREIALKKKGDGSTYSAKFVPILPDPNAANPRVAIRLLFPGGDLRGTATSTDVTIGDKTVPLAEIASITYGEEPGVRLFGASQVEGKATGLEALEIDLGGQVITVDATKASKISVTPPTTEQPEPSYKVVVTDKELKELATATGPVRIGAPPIPEGAIGEGPSLSGEVVIDGTREIAIPSKVHDVESAGNGKFLLLYLRDTRNLAVFDVTTLSIKGYINLEEDPAVFAGGAEHILISYPKKNLIVRHNLDTLEKERTVNNPLGMVDSIAIGRSSSRYAMMLAGGSQNGHDSSKIKVFDFIRMAAVEVGEVESHAFLTGTGNILRASADGRLYGCTKTSGSPSGVGIIQFKNGKLTTRYEHDSKGTVIPNPDGSLIFTTYGGVFTPDYIPVIKSNGNWSSATHFIPSYHSMYFFSVPPQERPSSGDKSLQKPIELYIKGSNQPLISLTEPFDEMRMTSDDQYSRNKSPFTVEKRYHFIPQLDLFLTIPESNDKIVARTIKVHDLLDEKEIDYLYVTSSPPPAVVSKPYTYQLEVASRAGGVKYSLQSGPDELDLSADGLITWTPPEKASEEPVIVSISDALGQETFYTFQIVVAPE